MSTVTLTPPNAILFVFDPSNQNVTVPDYVNAQLIAANATCISVGTQAPVDGDTVVSLCEPETYRKGLEKVFDGRIETPSRRASTLTRTDPLVLTKVDPPMARANSPKRQGGFARTCATH